MKLVLSRKGFDSGYGKIPSPILPDGTLISLPIPSSSDKFTFADLNLPAVDIDRMLPSLSSRLSKENALTVNTTIHLDPDLDRPTSKRMDGWRPALGQTSAAQTHLRGMGVGAGDVFVFFGWFRQVECINGNWQYAKAAPDLHVIFGWLEVAHVLPIVEERERCLIEFPWIANHPHIALPDIYTDPRNTLYVASEKSRFAAHAANGGGRFTKYSDQLRLTKPGFSRSVWSLPHWFMPNSERAPLSYHPRPDRWQRNDGGVTLRSAAKGQEFVLDSARYPEAVGWVADLIKNNA